MKKLLLKSMLLLCALIVGSSSVWATDITYTFSSKSWAASVGSTSANWTSGKDGNSYNNGVQVTTGVSGANGTSPISFSNVSAVRVNYHTNKNDGAGAIKVKVGSGTEQSFSVTKPAKDAGLTSKYHDFTFSNENGNVKITVTCSTNSIYIESVTITYSSGHTLNFSAMNGTIAGVDSESAAVANGASVAEGATVTLTATPSAGYEFSSWSVEGTGSTLTSTSTNPTTLTMGSANSTVTAIFVASSTPSIGLTTASVAATSAAADGNIDVTYNNIASVDAEVKFYESDGTTEADYSSWLAAEINVDKDLYYVIGENTGAARTAYMKVHEKNEDIYSELITITQAAFVVDAPAISPVAGAVTAGTTVTLTQASADQIRYTTDGTAPTKTTGTVYSTPIVVTDAITIKAIAIKNDVVSDVAEAAYTITVATPECNLASSTAYLEGTSIVLTSAGNTIYYNMTIDGDEPENPTSNSTEYTGPIALSSGNIRIKAIAYDAYNHSSTYLTRTFAGVASTTLPFNWTGGGKSNLISMKGVTSKGLGTDYASSNYGIYQVKFDNDGDFIQIFTSGQPGIVKIGAKTNGGTNNSSIKIQESPNGGDFTDVQTFEITGEQYDVNNLETTVAFATTTRVVRILFVKPSSGANVGVGPISIALPEPSTPDVDDDAHTVTLTTTANMAGWRTFAPIKANQNYTVDGTTKVYYASATAGGKVTLAEIAEGVPANTPVILHQTSGTTITLTETATSITAPGSNLLQVSTAGQNLGTVYRLGFKSTHGIGFYTYTTNSAPAGIIYLSSINAAREFLDFDFDDNETTGVNEVKSPNVAGEFFDLSGRKVVQPTKGLYIVNGKKVIIK